jgi:hypothetical protein
VLQFRLNGTVVDGNTYIIYGNYNDCFLNTGLILGSYSGNLAIWAHWDNRAELTFAATPKPSPNVNHTIAVVFYAQTSSVMLFLNGVAQFPNLVYWPLPLSQASYPIVRFMLPLGNSFPAYNVTAAYVINTALFPYP